ncbi:MAG: hypothetical protein COA96_17065 [SAR86 cluster bacterium]|uniref:Uncharacterized protein n=1 Tax=SAR86 cluster bacterium TaxID=2030880 RepID=A0A2A5AGF2_9GAMM|nr:MAG: hypothetical protein COA96_17065 [SAR86 cluster bacterium]
MTNHDVEEALTEGTDQSDIGGVDAIVGMILSPPADWREVIEPLPPHAVTAMAKQARAISVRAAMLSEYATARRDPDQGHDAGVEAARRIYVSARCLLGCDRPDSGVFSF